MVRPRKLTATEREAHRLRNRECMRKARQRRRRDLMEMEATVEKLEIQYAELYQRSANVTQDWKQDQLYTEAIATGKRLGAENLLLQTVLSQKVAWERQLQRILDFEASNMAFSTQFQSSTVDLQLDILNETQAAGELGFCRLTEWDLTRSILNNKRDVHHVESRLLLLSKFDDTNATRTHRMQAFNWDIVQRVEGGVMEFVFTKKFSGLDILKMLRTTWSNDMQLERFRKVKAETRRLQILQEMNPTVFMFVRDVASPSDISIFRLVFVRFLVEATREFPLDWCGSASVHKAVTGTGYILGTQSISTDDRHRLSEDEVAGELAWADLTLSIGAYDVVDPITSETSQYVRWAGRTDYSSEEHAQRNTSDTLQGMLRWEMLVIAPALNLVSLSLE